MFIAFMVQKSVRKAVVKAFPVLVCVFVTALCSSLLVGCQDKTPEVNTGVVSDITSTTATCSGMVVDNGAEVFFRGVCYNTSGYPTMDDPHTDDGSGYGGFVSHLAGLQPNTTYYVRAYAGNAKGVYYGEEVSFVTTDDGEDQPSTPIELLTIPQGWRMIAAQSSPAYPLASGEYVSNLLDGYFYDFEMDDIIVFSTDGTHRVLPGDLKPEVADAYQVETDLGQWHFDDYGNPTLLYMQLPFFYNYDWSSYDSAMECCSLLELSSEKLVIQFAISEDDFKHGKGVYIFTITYVPAQ